MKTVPGLKQFTQLAAASNASSILQEHECLSMAGGSGSIIIQDDAMRIVEEEGGWFIIEEVNGL